MRLDLYEWAGNVTACSRASLHVHAASIGITADNLEFAILHGHSPVSATTWGDDR
jgi:hypothetical protein